MRIVFTTWAWPSHLYAMVPLAWACRLRGHEVLVAAPPELAGAVERTGLPAAPAGRDVDAVAVFREIVHGKPGGGRPGGARGGPRVLQLLGELAGSMAGDLADLARGWDADLIVFEPTALAGPLAGAVTGVPAVRHLYGTDLLGAAAPFLADVLAPLSERLGLAGEVSAFGHATIDPCPGGLQVPTGSPRMPMRHVPYNGPGGRPAGLPAPSGRPRVCVTWGTTMSRLDPGLFLAGDAVRAVLADGPDVELVVAVTPGQRDLLGPLPDGPGVHVVTGTPLHLLLGTCDAVIAHGGAGTILAGLLHGLPQLLVPRLPDHVRHAGRLAEVGAAITVPAPVGDPADIANGLATLLEDGSYRAAAAKLRAEMLAQPLPADVVPTLERLSTGR